MSSWRPAVALGRWLSADSNEARMRLPVVPGNVSARLIVPSSISRPPYITKGAPPATHPPAQIHDGDSVHRLRRANRLARHALCEAGKLVQPGVTTDEIDRKVHEFITGHGAYPSPLGYAGFPKSICTSVNEVVVHGIPDKCVSLFFLLNSIRLGPSHHVCHTVGSLLRTVDLWRTETLSRLMCRAT